MTHQAPPATRHPDDQTLCDEIGFDCPWRYNAARLLFDNIDQGRGEAPAVIADSGTWTYAALGAEANRIGNALLARGFESGDRVLLFLDDEPGYPAAVMGAMKAGLVPILTNTLSPPDLVRFYVEDSGAKAAVISPPHRELFSDDLLAGTACETAIVTGPGSGRMLGWDAVASASDALDEAPTSRDDMAFWMYSSGSTGRPKGVVHRHEDALYTDVSYARNILKLTPDDICFSVPKIFFAYGFGNSVTFPFAAGGQRADGRAPRSDGHLRPDRPSQTDRSVRTADPLYGARPPRVGGNRRPRVGTAMYLCRRDPVGGHLQRLDRPLRP